MPRAPVGGFVPVCDQYMTRSHIRQATFLPFLPNGRMMISSGTSCLLQGFTVTTAPATLRAMSKKQTGEASSSPGKSYHKHPVLGLRLPADLVDLMRTLAARERRTLTAQISLALEEHLARHNLWPPSDQPEDS